MANNSHFEYSRQTHSSAFSMKSPHSHSHYEIFFLLSGECELQIGQELYIMKPGYIAFIQPDTPHKTNYQDVENERICIEYGSDYLKALFNTWSKHWVLQHFASPVFVTSMEDLPLIINTFDKISDELERNDIFSPSVIKHIFYNLIVYLIRAKQNSVITGRSTLNYNKNVEDAITYINENYMKHLTLTDVANKLHLNASYFSKQFKTINGIGFSEYLSNIRIIHSEKLLLETNKSITEIAFECGFDNSNYYGDVFKKKNKVSPSEFRKLKGYV